MNNNSSFYWYGLLAALIAMPFAALFYLAESIAELPFLPADFMNWLVPFIPGDLITFGINLMVDIIIGLGLGREDTVAKLFESLMAAGIFIGILGGVGALFGLLIERNRANSTPLPTPVIGLVIGIVVGIPFAIISDYELTGNNPFYTGPDFAIRTAWIVGMISLWGMITQVILQRDVAITTADATTTTLATTAQPVAAGTDAEVPSAEATPTSNPMELPVTRASVKMLNRRQFLVQVGGTTAALTVIGAGLGDLLREAEEVIAFEQENFSFSAFPNANAAIIPAPGTRPEYTPLEDHYRIDINTAGPPSVDGDAWRLSLTGLLANPTQFTLQELQDDFTPMNQYVTMSCISNRIAGSLISTIGWTGVSMQDILEVVRPTEEATHIRITSADGFFEYIDLDLIREDERIMLCYAWDEELLRIKHGFPLRIYIPDRYGMKQPKWITEMEFVDSWGRGYWVERGWSAQAIVQTTSVVDTVAVNDAFEFGGQTIIPIGGIAYAGARGISKVEVRIDDGEWVEAALRDPLSETTWTIWRYDWPMESGEHTFAVRCYDGNGTLQIEETRGNKPNGATGIHSIERNV